jgi:hypothetical protein
VKSRKYRKHKLLPIVSTGDFTSFLNVPQGADSSKPQFPVPVAETLLLIFHALCKVMK